MGVDLYEHNVRSKAYVHRLVAMAFVPGFSDGLEVNHKNGIKSDCRAANLEWVTHSENAVHARDVLGIDMRRLATRPRGESAPGAKLTKDQVIEIRRRRVAGESCESLGRVFSCSGINIRRVADRWIWKHVP